jgi:hypothetical protein
MATLVALAVSPPHGVRSIDIARAGLFGQADSLDPRLIGEGNEGAPGHGVVGGNLHGPLIEQKGSIHAEGHDGDGFVRLRAECLIRQDRRQQGCGDDNRSNN